MGEGSAVIDGVAAPAELSGAYKADAANSRLGFSARYAMVSTIRGQFTGFSAEAVLDGEDPTRSTVSVRIEAASLDTGQAQRDEHLRSPDFLDVLAYPQIAFQSSAVEVVGEGRYRLEGDLSICAVVRPVSVEMDLTGTSIDHRGYRLVGLKGSTAISRGAFGLTWNAALETGGVLVGDRVGLSFDVTLIRVSGPSAHTSARRWRSVLGLAR